MPPAAQSGVVVASYRRHFAVRSDDGESLTCVLKGRSTALACGDRVDLSRGGGGCAIEDVLARSTLFYRSDLQREKLIAANVTQVIGVIAPDISVDEELINRWIVATESQGCRFVLFANKSDKPDFDALLARLEAYAALGYPVVTLSAKRDVSPALPWLRGQRTVLIGQSGMGKSTILNAVVPGAAARTTEISEALAAGRHTTTHSVLYPLPPNEGDGWIVDSPGMKAFGLAHLTPHEIVRAFVELRDLASGCRFRDCRHHREPGCALREAIARGEVAPHRLALMRELIAASEAARDPASGRPIRKR
jgi:ribosome biogenesis GTPase